jgi:GT2 family glycosyltransferase
LGWKRSRATEETPPQPEPVVNGFFRGREQVISGWILDLKDSQRKHEVEIFVGGKRVGVARGDRFDALVQSHHGGDGNFAFAFYYNGDLNSGPVEAAVLDKESGSALRSKQPLVTRSARSGPPLTIDKLKIGNSMELVGRLGAYPWGNDATLEIWTGGERVVSSLPIVGVNESEGLFSAKLTADAFQALLGGKCELALPGLKEAGLAVPFENSPVFAAVSQRENKLRLELRGDFEQTGPIPIILRLRRDGANSIDQQIETTLKSRVATVSAPAGFSLADGFIELIVGGVAVPTRIEWLILKDPQFRELGQESSRWSVAEDANGEAGFFAFPAALADQHQLSGYTAIVSRTSGKESLRLFQVIEKLPAADRNVSVTAFVRAAKRAKLTARLRDDEGVIREVSATSKSASGWHLLHLELKDRREIAGEAIFEIEASGRNVDEMEVALGDSNEAPDATGESFGSNLLANPGFKDWPFGTGILEHSVRGEPCAGWRIFNRRTISRVFSRPVMHAVDGSLGLAVAAPEVKHYLRLEADFVAADVTSQPLTLRFRAGTPPVARQLLANEADATPRFAVLDRVYVIRRTRVSADDSFKESDEVVATFARKLPISHGVEEFSYSIPAIDEPDLPDPEAGERIEISYHLAFDFRHPTVVALFDVQVLPEEDPGQRLASSGLKVEDRNIELQIETLESLAHWRGPTPVRLATGKHEPSIAPLKWTAGTWREPVTIVIPVFNALTETLACLNSLNGSTTVPLLVRVVDDASDAPVREALEDYARDKPWIEVHSFPENRGYTFAADYGIRQARTEWIVLLNSDTVVTRGWLERMLACAQSDSRIAFVGPLSNAASYQSVPELYDAANKWKVNRLPPGMTAEQMAEIVSKVSASEHPEVPILNGFCTLMNRPAFIELGGLNPTAFPTGYGEENDLCFRAAKAGYKLVVADDAYVYHVKSASFGSVRRQELTKAGNAALAKLHPDVDIGALTAKFRETPALVAIRKAVAAELSNLHAPAGNDDDLPPALEHPDSTPGEPNLQPQLQKA